MSSKDKENQKENSEKNDVGAITNRPPKQENKEDKKSQNDKTTKNASLWKLILILAILLILLLFSTLFALFNLGKGTIAKGVSIKGIDVSNLSIEEATNKIKEAVNIEMLLGMNLVYGEEYTVDFDVSQIQYTYDIAGAVKQAYQIGKKGNILENNYALLGAVFFGKNVEIATTYQEESLNGIIDDIAAKIPGQVVQASYYIEGNQLMISKGKPGIAVEKEKLKQAILEQIRNRNALEIMKNRQEDVIPIEVQSLEPEAIDLNQIYQEIHTEPKDAYYILEPFELFPEENGVDFAISMEEAMAIVSQPEKEEFVIPLKITPASKTIDDIGTEAFPHVVSSYPTKYDVTNTNRSGNLKIAADKINGTVLMPGEEFSFNEVVGKRTIEDGYKNAKIYENGQVVDGLAGGICQISSTLYNAVLLANLEITQRRNHSYTTTYVPPGRDATVVYGTQDFKFKNSRKYPIKIEATVSTGIVEFKIHGMKEEIEYEIKIIPVTTQTIPYETEYIPDASLAPGQQVVKQAGHSGYKVTTYLEKRIGGAVVSKDILSNDTYKPMKKIVHIGQ